MNKTELTDIEVRPDHKRDEELGSEPARDYGRGELQVIELRKGNSVLRKLKGIEDWLDKKFGVETTGADRIPEDQRHPPSIFNVRFYSQLVLSIKG